MSSIIEFANKLDNFAKEQFLYKKTGLRINQSTICIYRKKCDLYLRYKIEWEKEKDVMVIARIGFEATRKGHGKKLLTFLCKMSIEHKFQHVGIECANSNVRAFGEKFGFKTIVHRNEFLDMTTYNLLINTEDLINNLNSH